MVHAPAVVHLIVDRDADDLGAGGWCLGGAQRAGKIDPIEAEDHVGGAERREPFRVGHQHRRRTEMLRMIGRETGADFQVGDDARASRFGKRDTRIPGFGLREARPIK